MKTLLIFVILTFCLLAVCYGGPDGSAKSYRHRYNDKKVKYRCKKNERYVECPATMCIAKSCSQLGFPIRCPRISRRRKCPGKPGCICKIGYLRNNKGVCIPKNKCPSCAGDPNAMAGCGFRCGKHCSRKIVVPKPCPCETNGCRCKRGFVYDDNIQECVLPSECTENLCPKPHEYYDPCPSSCPARSCDLDDRVVFCPKSPKPGDPNCPEPACRCEAGFYRDKNGNCVTWENCQNLCPKPHEYYDPCPSSCPARTCGFDDRVVFCAKPPEPGDPNCPKPACRCESGYFRDKNGDCVTWENCSSTRNIKTVEPDCSNDTIPLLFKGNTAFTGKFLNVAHKLHPKSSLIMSPCSVFFLIGQIALYAESDTYTQLLNLLNLRSKDDIRCVFPELISQMRAEQNIVLNLAARIFTTDVYPLTPEFLNDTKNVFDAEAESLNFADSVASSNRVNQWVESETNNRIKNIAAPDIFTQDTRLVLANAIYFLGNWIKQFNKDATVDRDFYVDSDTTINIPTMFQNGNFNYGEVESLDCKVLEMFYKGGNFSFVVFLPNKIDGISTLIENLQDSDTLGNAYSSLNHEKVDIFLPTIKTESEYNLQDILVEANVKNIFDPSLSRFNNILQTYQPLYVSTARQKAFIEVDETGTEAAAANIIGISTTSIDIRENKIFKADRPFVYYIFYKKTPIFCGKFHGPA